MMAELNGDGIPTSENKVIEEVQQKKKRRKMGRAKLTKKIKGTKHLTAAEKKKQPITPSPSPAGVAKARSKAANTKPQYNDETERVPTSTSIINEAGRRIAIAALFQGKFGMDSDENNWHGKNGIIPQIKHLLGIPRGTNIDSVLRACLFCHENGKTYNGETATARTGRNPILGTDTVEATIIANNLE